MNWTDKVLADPHLSRAARQLAAVIARNFAATNARYALFYLDTTIAAIRNDRYELMRCGYLVELSNRTGRPSCALRFGQSAFAHSDDAVA